MTKQLKWVIADHVFGQANIALTGIEIDEGLFGAVVPLSPVEVQALLDAASAGDVLDARGLMVLPGLVDAHVHAIATGMLMLGGDLHDVATLEEVAAAFSQQEQVSEDYIRLAGLDLSRLKAQDVPLLSRDWLDGLSPLKPFIIKSVEGHSSWFNTLAWERLGVSSLLEQCAVPEEEAAQMCITGRVYGEAYEKLANSIYDTYSAAERQEGMERMLTQAVAVGLTGIHCLEGYGRHRREDFELIQGLDGQACRLTLYARDSTPQLAAQMGIPRYGGCWCVDGAIGSHTAALSQPYADATDNCGQLYYSDAELSTWIEAGLQAELQVCVHAIGDRALEQVIGIYEKLAPKYDLQRLRPRVDHFILGTPAQAQRAARLGICSAMQPAFDARWGGETGGYATRLGPQRALETNPVGSMLAAGLIVAGSSDSYITPLDPLGGIRAAISHHNPEHRVDVPTAIGLFSSAAAYLARQEASRGRIAAGYCADLTILSGPTETQDTEVLFTIVGGEVKYRSRLSGAIPGSGVMQF